MKFIAAILVCGGFLPPKECQLIHERRVIYKRLIPCMAAAEAMEKQVISWRERGLLPDYTFVRQLSCIQAPKDKGEFTSLEGGL